MKVFWGGNMISIMISDRRDHLTMAMIYSNKEKEDQIARLLIDAFKSVYPIADLNSLDWYLKSQFLFSRPKTNCYETERSSIDWSLKEKEKLVNNIKLSSKSYERLDNYIKSVVIVL